MDIQAENARLNKLHLLKDRYETAIFLLKGAQTEWVPKREAGIPATPVVLLLEQEMAKSYKKIRDARVEEYTAEVAAFEKEIRAVLEVNGVSSG